ncbi:MAG: MaoC family dehydratase N-terminal domain-containing protein [Chloroflexi bacterium]|nr:MaoC family dehydratase N-terminal domain-containing protein [Chloroflexota bacterium]
MAEESIITPEMRQAIGMELEPVVMEVEKGHLRRFAQAIDDPNPLWQDEGYAQGTRYGSIIAPPTFLCTLRPEGQELPFQNPLRRRLNGGNRWQFFLPVRPGDVITGRSKISDIYEAQGRVGRLLFILRETTYTNQRGELVARHWGTNISY